MGERYKRTPNTSCLVCQAPIYRRPIELRRKQRVFCGSRCYGLASRKETPCVVCGVLILAHKRAKTCSRVCANTHRAGIKYKLSLPRKDKVKDQRALKLRLMDQRGTKCERCGYSKKEILHVHHRDRNRNNNDLSNLALICPNCHYEEHYLENSWLSGKVGF
ncbi:HNH endonuclease [Candidatus Kaiserbacteria bacterium]|nr:HNH endonuclease [Candidatus Kaiserbacteria bacterium]